MEAHSPTPIDFIHIFKRDILHKNEAAGVSEGLFRSLFGVSPRVCVPVYEFIRSRITAGVVDEEDDTFHYDRFEPKHLLWSLYTMKNYGTNQVMALFLKASPKTLRKWALFGINKISLMHEMVVSLNRISFD